MENKLNSLNVFVGTYTRKDWYVEGKAEGLYVYHLDFITGKLTHKQTIKDIINPSYLAVHPSKKFIYVIEETGKGKLKAYSFNKDTQSIQFINQVEIKCNSACYVSVDHSGKTVLVAGFDGYSSSFPIFENGSVGNMKSMIDHKDIKNSEPHAHMILQHPNNGQYVYCVDLGLDNINIFELDHNSHALINLNTSIKVGEGVGSRHMVFSKNMAYVLNQVAASIDVFKMNTPVKFESIQNISTITAKKDHKNVASADIHVHPNGKYLYASNRGGVNDIVIYEISPFDGKLLFIGSQSSLGEGPRSFVIEPKGEFLLVANQDSDDVIVFKIDEKTGLLTMQSKANIPTPICLKVL